MTVTRRVSLKEEQLLTLPEHLSSPPDFSGIRVAQSLIICKVFCISFFVLFLFVVESSVLRYTTSDYLFDILDLRLLITSFAS